MDTHLIQGSDSWKQKRRQSVSATDISKILSMNPYCSALKCFNQKLGLEPEEKENDAMRLGSELEPIALQMFSDRVWMKFTPKVIFHADCSWKMASLDGISPCGNFAVEIKCSKNLYERAKNGIIDEIYRCQVQWQMYILKIPMIYFCCYWDNEIVVLEIERDDDFLNEIMPIIHDFYRRMIEFDPPPPSDKDYVLQDSKEWRMLTQVWKEAVKERKEAEQKEEDARNELIRLCDGKSSKGHGIKVCKTIKKGAVDYGRIELLKDVDLDAYRKKSVEYYRISEE